LIRKDFDEDFDFFSLHHGTKTSRAPQDQVSSFEEQIRITFGHKKTKSQDGGNDDFVRASAKFPHLELRFDDYEEYKETDLTEEKKSLRLRRSEFLDLS